MTHLSASFRSFNLTIAALGGCAAASLAHAQSSVTLYGIADAYVGDVRGSTSVRRMGEGAHTASRLGFRGREDLGNGAYAHYTLEMGLNLPDGSIPLGGGFGRQAFVGLGGKSWGQISLGLQYTPVFMQLLRTATFGMNVNWAPLQAITRPDSQGSAVTATAPALRLPSMLRYRWGGTGDGLSVDLAFAPNEGLKARGSVRSVGLAYQAKQFFVGASTQRVRSGAESAPASTYIHAVSGYWQADALKINLNYVVTGSSAAGARSARNTVVGARYQWGPHALLAEVAHRDVRRSPNDALVVGLGYDYSLSKRTRLYGRLMHVHNRHEAGIAMGTASVKTGSGDDVRAMALGLIHTF